MKRDFLNDIYATKMLVDEDCRDFLLAIISKTLDLNIDELKNNFELVDIRTGLSDKVKDIKVDVAAKNNKEYFNIEVNYIHSAERTNKICSLLLRNIKPGNKNRYSGIRLL